MTQSKYIKKEIAKKDSIKAMADEVIEIHNTDNLELIFGKTLYRLAKIKIEWFGFYTFNMDGKKIFVELINN